MSRYTTDSDLEFESENGEPDFVLNIDSFGRLYRYKLDGFSFNVDYDSEGRVSMYRDSNGVVKQFSYSLDGTRIEVVPDTRTDSNLPF